MGPNEEQYPSIRIGGLLRCCLATVSEIGPPTRMLKEGDTLACSYCDDLMRFRDGAWEWNRD